MVDVKNKMAARLAILKAINHPAMEMLDKQKKGDSAPWPYNVALEFAFALYGPSADVVRAAYFNEAGEKIHSPMVYSIAAHKWVEDIGDQEFSRLIADVAASDTEG